MHKIKLGNDIQVVVSIMRDDVPEDLSTATNIEVEVSQINAEYKTLPIHSLAVNGNKVSFLIKGSEQLSNDDRYLGVYVVTITYNQPDPIQNPPLSMHTVDALAFELIAHSFANTECDNSCPNVLVETIELTGNIAIGKNGITPHIGENGNWWIGEEDTGVLASGDDGKSAYASALDGGLPEEVTEVEFNQMLAMNSDVIGDALDVINGEGYDDNVVKKITRTDNTKQGIAEAIVAKGEPVADTDTFASYAPKIREIKGDIENFYTQCGFADALGDAGVLMEMARISYEITKDWTDYDTAHGNRLIRFVPLLDISDTTALNSIFDGCSGLISLTLPDIPLVTSLDNSFYGCYGLTSITLSELPLVTTLENTFDGCSGLTSITLPELPLVTALNSTFNGCYGLTSLTLPELPLVTTLYGTFNGCYGLTSLTLPELPLVTTLHGTFIRCSGLTSLTLPDIPLVTALNSTFYGCTNLMHLSGFKGLKVSVDFSASTKLTVESMMNVIRNASDMTGLQAFTITFGATNLAKLTDEQKAEATNKNITLS